MMAMGRMAGLQVSLLLLLQLLLTGLSSAMLCVQIPGNLKQIDVSNGHVFGVNYEDQIYTWYENSWTQINGALKHVSVGPAGIWGVNRGDSIYRMVGGKWVQMQGLLKQIDAGGDEFISGANSNDDIFCMSKSGTIPAKVQSSSLPWVQIEGKLKYISCGSLGCWGVNSGDDIYYLWNSSPDSCQGSSWQHVEGKLSMIEAGTEGTVYGVNAQGMVYHRDGITASNPIGTSWIQVDSCGYKFKHVSYDLGFLWMLTTDGTILKCSIACAE
ncbi:fish-egg lectin [Microcaecilia unicolor]|uniref:Fish-egg lectin-like n=1 Tax=Microcaecilia unicolor TaxID=1415580 RepID=A0A6P7Z1T4_9AMPH|nr:fish-egg lectin-like [Microcaecilia unicolor]